MEKQSKHISVLKDEMLNFLQIKPAGTYLDLTIGGGGHSLEILRQLHGGTLISFDTDIEAITQFEESMVHQGAVVKKTLRQEGVSQLTSEDWSLYLVNKNFSEVNEVLRGLAVPQVDGVIADLGWSSDQLEHIPGLSYTKLEDPLDMRLSSEAGVTAADLLNALGRSELKKMFENYADIFGADNRALVEEIVNFKKRRPYEYVVDLRDTINKIFTESYAEKNHLNARIFQALRIAVNMEFQSLEAMLSSIWSPLSKNAVLIIISFHSGEENIIRSFIKDLQKKSYTIKSTEQNQIFIRPSIKELTNNARSRSAKLWAIQKIV